MSQVAKTWPTWETRKTRQQPGKEPHCDTTASTRPDIHFLSRAAGTYPS